MGKRQFQPGDKVQFPGYDEQGKPCTFYGVVAVYKWPAFYRQGYIEIVNPETGEMIMFGNAGDRIQKCK